MRNAKIILVMLLVLILCLTGCSAQTEQSETVIGETSQDETSDMAENDPVTDKESADFSTVITRETAVQTGKYSDKNEDIAIQKDTGSSETSQAATSDIAKNDTVTDKESADLPTVLTGKTAVRISKYVDENGDIAIIPKDFTVSAQKGEHTVNTGVVVIGPDGSEFVWVPTTQTELAVRDFGSYFSGGSISGYWDETDQTLYQEMVKSVEQYGGFYMGRFEASCGGGNNVSNYIPASKRLSRPWVRFSPQDTAVICQNLYADNKTVQGFFPWGINYDTTLQWLIDSGCKTEAEVTRDSTIWGNYSDDTFSKRANGSTTGQWEETSANNIYDLAGNNWEWTQERYGTGNYVMRGGGYNLMGGSCSGADYPAALRDPLPGNDHHPNVTFRVALFVK